MADDDEEATMTTIGIGLAALGRPGYINLGHGGDLDAQTSVDDLEQRSHRVLDAAWDAGVRYFDVARSYGLAERFVGSWLALHARRRAALTIGSKWGYTYTADWRIDDPHPERKTHDLVTFERQWPETLAALGGAPDLYLVHSLMADGPVFDDAPLLDALRGLAATGVRVGFSTSGPRQFETIERALALGADSPFSAVQCTWNLLEPSVGAAAASAHDAGYFVVVKEAVANGRLTPKGGVDGFAELAERLGSTEDAVAIGAALAQPWPDVVLSGATTVSQLESNLRSTALDAGTLERLTVLAEDPEAYWARRSSLVWN